jgi:hypothetical protein
MHARVQAALVNDGVGCVACREQNREPGPEPHHFLGNGAAVHPAPQHHIGKEKFDLGMLPDDLQCLSTVCRLKNAVPEVTQSLDGIGPQVRLIFDNQDRLA